MKKFTLLWCLLLCFSAAMNSQQIQTTSSTENLLNRYSNLGNKSYDISHYFSKSELQILKQHFSQKQAPVNNVQAFYKSLYSQTSFESSGKSGSLIYNDVAGTATKAMNADSKAKNVVPVVITHSATQNILANNSVTCNAGGIPDENSFYRDFDLANDFGISGDFTVTNAEFAVEAVSGPVNLTINIYSTSSTFPSGFPGSATLQGTANYVSNTGDAGLVVSVPVSATIPAGEIMIYELNINLGAVNSWFPGSNADGQTGVSWIESAACGITVPTDLAAIGFPDQHMVMNIVGEEGGGGGGGPSIVYGNEAVALIYGSFDATDPSVLTPIGAPATSDEYAGAIDPSDPTTAYVLSSTGTFSSLDIATGVYTNLGTILPPGAETWAGLEFDPTSGTLYALSTDIAVSTLASIDIGSVTKTTIGATGMAGGIALAVDGAGNGWSYDILDDNLYSVDLATGTATVVGSIGFDANFAQGMTWDPNTDTVYMAAFNNGAFQAEWRSVDTATGATTLIGVINPPDLSDMGWVSIPGDGGTPPPPTCISTLYESTAVPFDIDGAGSVTADCANAPNLIPVTVGDSGTIGGDANIENVTIDVTHSWDSDLTISLVSPNGTELILSEQNGGSGDNYTNTIFMDGGDDITGASPPFTGTFAPEGGSFAAAFDGESITGDWNLKICDAASGDSGQVLAFSISICIPPDNDTCEFAKEIACGDTVTGDTSNNSDQGGFNTSPDEWFKFTGSGSPEVVTLSLCGTGFDTVLTVYDSCGGAQIVNNDDFCGLQSQVSFLSDGTSTYYVAVEGFGSNSGPFSMEVTCATPPENDLCEDAIAVSCGDSVMGTTINSTLDAAPECGTPLTSPGVWYSLTDDSGLAGNITLSLCNDTDYDSKISVYTGDCGTLTCVDGNDDSCGLQSEVTFPSDGNTTFLILIHGFGGATGDFTMDVTCLPTPPPNDMIANSIDVDEIGFPYTDPAVAMPAATTENGNPNGCDLTGANGVWYNFVPAADGTATASIGTPGGASSVTFYFAPDENSVETDLTLVPQQPNQCAPGTSASINTVGGQAYYVFVLNTGAITDITIDGTNLGIGNNTIEGFSYYPNPSTDIINLKAANNIETVTVYSLLGQKVIESNINAATSQLNVSALSTGTYIMKVSINDEIGTYKIIKN